VVGAVAALLAAVSLPAELLPVASVACELLPELPLVPPVPLALASLPLLAPTPPPPLCDVEASPLPFVLGGVPPVPALWLAEPPVGVAPAAPALPA